MKESSSNNPTDNIDLNFSNYLEDRKRTISSHLIGGIPDYAFSLDCKLRQQLASITPVRAVAKSLVSMAVPIYRQVQQMEAVAVGTQQYPEIYALGEECARILGIGIPQIFVYYSPSINAYTIATDDVEPIIILSSAIVEALDSEELKFVIGHECGHIQNLHGVYNTAVELMTNSMAAVILKSVPGLGTLKLLLQGGLMLFFSRWSRCAEITCDRAGLICCRDIDTAQMALAKLATGGVTKLDRINLKEYIKQISQVQSSPVRLLELTRSHPLTHKRIEALTLFSKSEILGDWHQELSVDKPINKTDLDHICEKFIAVLATGYKSGELDDNENFLNPSQQPREIEIN